MSDVLIDVPGLVALLADPTRDVVVADATVRLEPARHDGDHRATSGRDAWEADRIEGSIHLDLGGELADRGSELHFAHPPAAALATALAARGIGSGTTVVAYDRGDTLWASRLWWTLRWIGIDVRVLDGGLPAWRAASPGVAAAGEGDPAPSWTPTPRPGAWATRDDVEAIVGGRAAGLLVCGLGADAFTGSAPTRYARRGHIPGSVNVPARGHVGPDGRLRGVDELRDAYAGLTTRPLVLYCGGGISATLNALALVEAGVEDVTVYDGSLEEWAADPALPLVTSAG